MKKIAFLINQFKYSGILNQVVNLANSLSEIYKIEIICLEKLCDCELNKKVVLTELNYKNSVVKFINDRNIVNELNNRLKDIDIVVFNESSFIKYIDKLEINDKYKIYWMHTKYDVISDLKLFDKVVIPNKNISDSLILDNSKVIPNSIEIPKSITNYEVNNKLIFVGNLSKNKCINTLIDMMSIINDKDNSVILNIIGDGGERSSILSHIKELGLSNNVFLLGSYNRDDLLDELRDSTLFVSTSDGEMFNLAILEAMSVGLPVVAFDNDSVNYMISDDIDGKVIKDKNINEMADVIISLLNDKNSRENLGGCAIEKSINFDVNVIKLEWVKLFK